MRFTKHISLIVNQLILILLLFVVIALPTQKKIATPLPFTYILIVIDALYIVGYVQKKGKRRALSDIMFLALVFLGAWEIAVTKLNLMHPVLFPAPENVFNTFFTMYDVILKNVFSSLTLLIIGVTIGLASGVILGICCGWVLRLRGIFYPIASVLAPIPSLVYAPYIIAVMPTFRSASAMIVILGIFFPCFLNMIIRVDSFDKRLLDVTRVMELSDADMIFSILLPYVLPGVISGLKVTLTSAVAMLTFAEMMGATSGMGYFIVNYNTYGNYTNVIAGIIVTGLVVLLLNTLVGCIQKRVIKWSA